MKIKSGFILRQVMGQTVVVAIGERSKEFCGMIRLNDTGTDIWQGISEGLTEEEIAQRLVETYSEVDMQGALSGTRKMIAQMKDAGILE